MPTYMTVRMTRDHDYKDRQLRAGETVELPRRDAALLVATRKATKGKLVDLAPLDEPNLSPVLPDDPQPPPTPPARDPLDHDGDGHKGGSPLVTADDAIRALRSEYATVLGKNPFNGWGADELRERIAAHKAAPTS